MDVLQRYFDLLEELCSRTLDDERSAYAYYEDSSYEPLTKELVQRRRELLSASDIERVADLISLGLLPSVTDPNDRAAAFMSILELEDRLRRERRKRACGRYETDQPLFQASATIWGRVRKDGEAPGDLIDPTGLAWDGTSQLVDIGSGQWARIDSALRSDTARWVMGFPPGVTKFVRLDPFHVGSKIAPLAEATIRPAAPDWVPYLKVWPGTVTGAAYMLRGDDPKDLNDYWDFHARGVRRLEVSFRRRNSGHFFGSIEELSVVADDFVVGLMLHMDSIDPVGTEWTAAMLGHLDGAINVFEGPTARERLNTYLHDGKVPDATTRTHLFRVDNVPLSSLVPAAHLFLRSERLLSEWIREQFAEFVNDPGKTAQRR